METQTQFNKLGDIVGTNTMVFSEETPVMNAVLELLERHNSGAPVFNNTGDHVGYFSESNLLDFIIAGKNLDKLKIKDIMSREHYHVDKSTSVKDAMKFMRDKHLQGLLVLDGRDASKTVTRHDLIRVSLGVDLGVET